MATDENSWRTQNFRQNVVAKLYVIFKHIFIALQIYFKHTFKLCCLVNFYNLSFFMVIFINIWMFIVDNVSNDTRRICYIKNFYSVSRVAMKLYKCQVCLQQKIASKWKVMFFKRQKARYIYTSIRVNIIVDFRIN